MLPAGAAEDDTARDVNKIGCRDEVTKDEEKSGHGFSREDVTREKDAGKDGEESELHGFRLGVGLARDKDAKRERDKDVREREDCEEGYAAVDGHLKDEAHKGENHAEFDEPDDEIGKKLSEQ